MPFTSGMLPTGWTSAPKAPCAVLPRPHLLSRGRVLGQQPCKSRSQHRSKQVTCMANPRRQAKVAKQIEREVGNLLLTDMVLQKAVCPEKRIGIDSAVSAIASVTEVEVSTDLAIAKVYLSIFSDDLGKSIAMSGLKRLEGYVRKHIATSMNLRMAPEVRFLQDDTIARAEHVYALLDQLKAERGSSISDTESEDKNGNGASPPNPVAETNEEPPSLGAAIHDYPEAPVGSDVFTDAVATNKGAGRRSSSTTKQRTPSLRFQKRS